MAREIGDCTDSSRAAEQETVQALLYAMTRTLGAQTGLIYLWTRDRQTLEIAGELGISAAHEGISHIPLGSTSLVGLVARDGSTRDMDGALPDALYDARAVHHANGGRFVLASRIMHVDQDLGIAVAGLYKPADAHACALIEALSGLAAVGLSQARRRDEANRDEQTTKRSHLLLRRLFDLSPESILFANDQGTIIDGNPAACTMLKMSQDQIIGRGILEITADVQQADTPRRWASFLEMESQVGAYQLRRYDGSTIEVDYHAIADVLPGCHVSFMHDASKRAGDADKLREMNERLRRAQRIGQMGDWEWDIRTNEIRWSDECARISGLDHQNEGMFASFIDHVHPDDVAKVNSVVKEILEHGAPCSFDFRMTRPDGREIIVHEEITLDRGDDGKPRLLAGTIQDVTEQRRLLQERDESLDTLARERRWLQTVFDSSPIGVLLGEGAPLRRISMNRRGIELLDISPDEKDDLDLIRRRVTLPDGTPLGPGDLGIERALRGEVLIGRELLVQRTDGTKLHVLVNACPINDDAGGVQGAVVMFVDITALKDLEKLREEWTSVMAHDLRQPLTTILIAASLLSKSTSDPTVANKAARIHASAERLIRLITDLADLSKLEARRLDLIRTPTDLVTLVTRKIEGLPDEEARARIAVSIENQIPILQVDEERIEQVLDNLLSNALKYGTPRSPIEVSLTYGAGEVVVRVTNEGPGIDRGLMPRLFSRFQRASNGEAPRIKGSGLGLYICRGLIEAHGGHIDVESEPGQTTTFWFTLPASA